MSKERIRLKPHEIIALGFEQRDSSQGNPKYWLNDSQKAQLQKIRDFHQTEFKEVRRSLNEKGEVISTIEKLGSKKLIDIPENHVIKRVSTNVGTNQQWIISEPIKNEKEAIAEIDFLSIFKDKVEPLKVNISRSSKLDGCIFDRAVITDIHLGMDVNKDGYTLYDGLWNESELMKRVSIFVSEIIKNQKSNILVLHDLGDLADGWNGFTTRGGHALPQNMDNQKVFDVGLMFKIQMLDSLFEHYDTIKIVNICNDNHGGAFTYIINSAFKTFAELKYSDNVEVINQRKFIDHYIIENKCFILCHGKDDKSLKFGFKPFLDAVQIEKIKNYIDEYKLHQYEIEFSKGDSHQLMFDLTSSTAFEYQNFGAFSPPSDWVKCNFKNTKSSFTTFNYYDKQKTINNYIF
jgi:hypothetical protein